MRVTNSMMISQLLYNLEKNMTKMSRKQDELATGKSILRASDDPVATSKILKYKSDISDLEQYSVNTRDSLNWLEISESSLDDLGEVMKRAKEIAIQAANGVASANETKLIRSELEQLRKQVITDGNVSLAGRFIFSGFNTDKPLFKEDGTYNIDITNFELNNIPKTKYKLGPGEDMEISSSGIEIFGTVAATTIADTIFTDQAATGSIGSKSILSGTFDFTQNYNADTLDITLNGTTYNVDETGLIGSNKLPLDKGEVLDRIRNADNGGVLLSDVADVYFDQNDQLVIKSKSYGPDTISTGSGIFAPTYTAGANNAEASVSFPGNTFDDAFIAANETELKTTPMYVTVNGSRQRIVVDPAVTLNTTGDYQLALQNALDNAFGAGSTNVALNGAPPNEFISIATTNTPGNIEPEIKVELIQSQKSQMVQDFDDMILALDANDKAGITAFIGKVEAHLDNVLEIRAEIGAKVNRVELIDNRITQNLASFTRMLSETEDADMAEVIMKLQDAENVYKSALSTGARVIQPTLIDFLR